MLIRISNLLIPMVVFYIVGYGMLKRVNLFDAFIKGAQDGIKVVVEILPTLIGLLVAIAAIRASGIFEWMGQHQSGIWDVLHFPQELVPLVIIKMISSSAATGLLLDIYKTYGTDSQIGVWRIAGSSESLPALLSAPLALFSVERLRRLLHSPGNAPLAHSCFGLTPQGEAFGSLCKRSVCHSERSEESQNPRFCNCHADRRTLAL